MGNNDADPWDSLVAQADVHLRSGNAERLESIASALIEADPLNSFGYLMRAEADRERERFSDATRAMREAIACDPEDAYLHYRLAAMERLDHDYDEAEAAIDQALRQDPDDADYWVEKAEILYWVSDYEAAREALDHAFDLEPEHADGIHLVARIEDMDDDHGSPQEAIGHYLEALEAEPENGWVHRNLAESYLSAGKYELAYGHAEEALRLEPTERDFKKTLYRALRRRSWPYRALTAPGRWIWKGWTLLAKIPWLAWIVLVIANIGTVAFFLLVGLTVMWAAFLWPVVKAYEIFTLGDLRERTREVGGRGGGLLGFHRWPFAVRMTLFLGVTAAFWYGLWSAIQTPTGATIGAWVIIIAVLLAIVGGLIATFMDFGEARARRRRKRNLVSEGP